MVDAADRAVADAAEEWEDEDKDEAVVATTSYEPITNIPTIYLIFKAGEKKEANAATLIALNGVTAVASTSNTTAPTADTV